MRFIAVLFLFMSLSAIAGPTAETCFSKCKVIDRAGGSYRCMVTYSDGVGGIMIVDRSQPASEKEKSEILELRDCFFAAGGGIFESHSSDQKQWMIQCSETGRRSRIPFTCERISKKHSMRHLKPEDRQ